MREKLGLLLLHLTAKVLRLKVWTAPRARMFILHSRRYDPGHDAGRQGEVDTA